MLGGAAGRFLNDLLPTFALLLQLSFPISLTIAIARFRLWDIDLIIRRTLIYSLLTLTLGLLYFASVAVLQSIFSAATGQIAPVAIVLSTLLIAAAFNPLRHYLQGQIDRRYFRRKYDAQQVLAHFAQAARDETDLERLAAELQHVVDETMQPEHATLWLLPGE
jgi:hypothetical protein